jgi:hypothetical protein
MCNSGLPDLAHSWDDVCEVLARRSVIVRWGGHVDMHYLERLPAGRERPAIGEALITDAAYTEHVIRLFEYLGIALVMTWLARLLPDGPVPAGAPPTTCIRH